MHYRVIFGFARQLGWEGDAHSLRRTMTKDPRHQFKALGGGKYTLATPEPKSEDNQ